MDIKILAIFLVAGHFASATFIFMVLIRQMKLFKLKAQHGLKWFRRVLFILALSVFFGNFIPIFIDVLTIFNHIKRSTGHVNAIGVAYSISNAIVFALSALLIWILYRLAASTVLIVEHDKDVALNKKGDS